MHPKFEQAILQSTKAKAIIGKEIIQSLWSGYGEISRVYLEEGNAESVVVKNVVFPTVADHPRGWNTSYSHERKVRSYEVEMQWYKQFGNQCTPACRIPRFVHSQSEGEEHLIVLEDLDKSGFPLRKKALSQIEIHACLSWLAHFHAIFMQKPPQGLWQQGTYWQLDTRPDELKAMASGPLKRHAKAIDQKLKQATFQTFVHGDAKVANFCFPIENTAVAAVDFQYVGGGCGMKDVAYFLGSCLEEEALENLEEELLDYYFTALRKALLTHNSLLNCDILEKEWRNLYPFAWADFNRFLLGWMPSHRKINRYSQSITERAIAAL